MDTSNIIRERMENIRTIFQEAKNFAVDCNDIDDLIQYLENLDAEFRSVAYEAVAMSLALKDFTLNKSLNLWNALLSVSQQHAGQVHIGLGWAIAEATPADLSFMNTINLKIIFRVWDSCGYSDGIIKYRQTIITQSRQSFITENNFQAYDQGIGRAIWYNSKGNPSKVAEMIQTFSVERQADLWRGVGIASSYVGGCEESILKNLYSLAEKHSIQLSIGAAMVAKSRTHAGSITKDITLACNVWCNLSVNEAMLLTMNTESTADSFESFILQMEIGINNISDKTQNPVRGNA